MSIFEYNEEEELKKLRASERKGAYEEAYEDAYGDAVLLTRIECILELLQDYGEIPDDLKQKISSEKDMAVLTKWHKLAAHTYSIEEFTGKMG